MSDIFNKVFTYLEGIFSWIFADFWHIIIVIVVIGVLDIYLRSNFSIIRLLTRHIRKEKEDETD